MTGGWRRRLGVAAAATVMVTGAVLASAGPAQARTATHTSVAINHHTIRVGKSATISGHVSPNQHGHRITLQRKANGHWHSVAHKVLTKASRYSFRVRPARAGTYHYRVYDPKTRHAASSHSRTVTLTVRPKPATSCTPGYSPCIPPGSDVDCAGGSGNGPRYVHGPVYVTGSDPYGLDRDGDGVACE